MFSSSPKIEFFLFSTRRVWGVSLFKQKICEIETLSHHGLDGRKQLKGFWFVLNVKYMKSSNTV